MKYFRLAYDIIANRILFHLLIVVEIAAMLILTNITIASYNSKKMLIEPYEELLTHKGVPFITNNPEEYSLSTDDEIMALIDDNGLLDYDGLMDLIKSKVEGIKDISYREESHVNRPDTELYAKVTTTGIQHLSFYYIDHDIFTKLNLPLQAGRMASSEKNENGELEVVVSGGTNAELDHVYNTINGKIKVVGILTDTTYCPPGTFPDYIADEALSIVDYYDVYDTNEINDGAFVLLDQDLVPEDKTNIEKSSTWFITFNDDISDETMSQSINTLMQYGIIRWVGDEPVTYRDIERSNENYLQGIYTRMLPVILSSAIVVMAGLLGSIAVTTLRQKKNFAIYFLCGCQWKDSMRIMMSYLSLLIALSGILTILAILVTKLINLDAIMGSVYGLNNLIISIAELLLMYLLAIILPHRIIKSTSPVETIKEN